jgi:hypothetical protein
MTGPVLDEYGPRLLRRRGSSPSDPAQRNSQPTKCGTKPVIMGPLSHSGRTPVSSDSPQLQYMIGLCDGGRSIGLINTPGGLPRTTRAGGCIRAPFTATTPRIGACVHATRVPFCRGVVSRFVISDFIEVRRRGAARRLLHGGAVALAPVLEAVLHGRQLHASSEHAAEVGRVHEAAMGGDRLHRNVVLDQ